MSEICESRRVSVAFSLSVLTGDVNSGSSLGVGSDVSEVTNVALGGGGGTVVLAVGVEVRARRSAAVAHIAEGMNLRALASPRTCATVDHEQIG
jgi:hypothetical protein